MKNRNAVLFALLVSSAVLLGCTTTSTAQRTYGHGEAENVLQADGPYKIVEDENGTTPEQQHQNAHSQVDPAKGSNSEAYTSHTTPDDLNGDTRRRVLRLEHKVAGLDRDFKKLLPPLSEILVSDQKLDQTIQDIQTSQAQDAQTDQGVVDLPPLSESARPLTTETVSTPAAVSKPVALKAPAKTAREKEKGKETPKISAPEGKGPRRVSAIRVGEHPGKTRLVLDVDGPVKQSYDIDNGEHLLLIELPGAAWGAADKKTFGKSPLLKSYTAQPSQNGGTALAVELAKPAKVTSSGLLPPAGSAGYRVFFDLSGQ